MLSQTTPVATLATADLSKARPFYEDTLGLAVQREGMGGVFYSCGTGRVFVYESAFAGTNKATALTFDVDDIGAEVRELKDKGVFFESYDMPGLEKQGDLYVAEGMKTAWFKDPDGNILSLFEGKAEA